MKVYVVEEYLEDNGINTEIIGVYGSKKKALAKVKEMEELYNYNEYSVTTYDTVTGGIVNDQGLFE